MSAIDDLAALYRQDRKAYLAAQAQRDAGQAAHNVFTSSAQNVFATGTSHLQSLGGLMGNAGMGAFGIPPPAPSRGRVEIGVPGAKNTTQPVSACAPVKEEPLSEHHKKHEEWLQALRGRPNAKP